VYYRDHPTIPDAFFHPAFYLSSYILPRDPQERLRSNKLLNRIVPCELVGNFISSHSGMPRDPVVSWYYLINDFLLT